MFGLLKISAERGWMCYEELNWALPDELLFPEKIDELLVLLKALNVELIGEDDRMRRGWKQYKCHFKRTFVLSVTPHGKLQK